MIVGDANWQYMEHITDASSIEAPLSIQPGPELADFNFEMFNGGQCLNLSNGKLKKSMERCTLDKQWNIDRVFLSDIIHKRFVSKIRDRIADSSSSIPIQGDADHNIHIPNIDFPEDIRQCYHDEWHKHVVSAAQLIVEEANKHPWAMIEGYLRWSECSSPDSFPGFGSNGVQAYIKRGHTFGGAHDEIGDCAALNQLVVDQSSNRGVGHGASLWVGFYRSDLVNAGYTKNDILSMHHRCDVSVMLSELRNRGVRLYYCIQKKGDLVMSPPAKGSMHMVVSIGDLVQLALNHGFTTDGYRNAIEFWRDVRSDVVYNSAAATINVLKPSDLQVAFPTISNEFIRTITANMESRYCSFDLIFILFVIYFVIRYKSLPAVTLSEESEVLFRSRCTGLVHDVMNVDADQPFNKLLHDMAGLVDLCITDPPWGILQAPKENDSIAPGLYKRIVDICAAAMKPGGSTIILCSFLDVGEWIKACQAKAQEPPSGIWADKYPLVFTTHGSASARPQRYGGMGINNSYLFGIFYFFFFLSFFHFFFFYICLFI